MRTLERYTQRESDFEGEADREIEWGLPLRDKYHHVYQSNTVRRHLEKDCEAEIVPVNLSFDEPVKSSSGSEGMTERERVAVELYSQELVSQEIAAYIAGVSRSKFLEVLSRAGVSPFQYTADELHEDLMRVQRRRVGREL
jgi:predicted HTH domain antitoxin